MKKRYRGVHPSAASSTAPNSIAQWRNVPADFFGHYARTFHTAAKKLAAVYEPDPGPLPDFAACPVVLLYRQALELQLKAIVLGAGGNFLATPADHISVSKTHSLAWLGQSVCQIITRLQWDKEFRCEGVENLTDFKTLVEDVNRVDPGPCFFRFPGSESFNVPEFAARMDALIELLECTADALTAEWDLQLHPDLEIASGKTPGKLMPLMLHPSARK